ncbi:hypothetical protein SPRG_19115 [Saprolegnia parasitica CBS 223.65]|uniref:tRNA-uridine aminocarboxypropyltransferase 1 n=1 Tax=Saprolegnia parasitica (strain CBS 223.65) TaxID=695850 RepID=A0A067D5L9_SAPPC|nr:hypothetical protein SPRG_19115 [Saprolegnia parasitica CBS 223.65]KDO34297.1 hypothetical protein SPRG_19115 [Saprolegnia parasitica CBS 223.65]|eukprot:XP_012195308.1 hypothetical protein SPRG_19115 [Saprolegnia parasitica CBS 223.65]
MATVAGWTREVCPTCKKSSKFYCATCFLSLGAPSDVHVPRIKLPVTIDVIFHDKIKKSTAPQGKVVAPEDIHIIPFPYKDGASPVYDPAKAVVVYPSNDAFVLDELEDLDQLETLIFIDCPWQKGPAILNDKSLSHLRTVKLAKPPLHSKFWRYHSSGDGCVSTIEAVYLMLEEYTAAMHARNLALTSTDDVSEILYYFNLVHDTILETHKSDPNRQLDRAPMSEAEKERQRLLRSQKEQGQKRKRENREAHKRKVAEDVAAGVLPTWPAKKCYNCDTRGHEAKACPEVCRYCKVEVHFHATCPMKGVRPAESAVKYTKAL